MKPLKALIIEDSKDDATLVLRHLSAAEYEVQATIVESPTEMKAALAAQEWDVVLSDYTMPHFSGLEALSILKETGLDIPFIIISGTIGEDIAVEAMRCGIHDYLMKDNLKRLVPAIEREMLNAAIRHERRQAEEALRRSERNLTKAQRIAHIGSWETDLVNNHLFWSDEVYEIFGVSKAEFGATLEYFLTFIHPEDRQSVQSATDAALLNGAAYNVEHRIITSAGIERFVCELGEVIFDEAGKPLRMTGTVQDITERKRAEEQLRQVNLEKERQARTFDTLLTSISDMTYTFDRELRFRYANKPVLDLYGMKLEHLVGKNFFDLDYPTDLTAKIRQNIQQVFDTGESVEDETRFLNAAGESGFYEYVFNPVISADGTVELVVGSARDITKRKKAEESINFQAHLLNTVEQSVIATDLEGTVTYWNHFAEELYGWTAAEAFGRNIIELTTPEISQKQAAKIMAQLRTGKSWSGEFIVRNKNGTAFPAYVSNSPDYDGKGTLVGIVGVSTDITERIDSEKTLRESETRFRLLCEAAPLGVFLTDADGGFLFTNPYLQEVGGFSFDEALGGGFVNFIHPEDRRQMSQEWKEATAAGSEWSQQCRLLHRDGTIRWVGVRTAPIVSANNRIVSHVGTIEDITARKLAEESLRQAEAQYRSLVESSPAIVYLAQPTPPFAPIYVSPNIIRFGYTAEEWFSRPDMWSSLILEEDRERVLRTTEAALNQGLDSDIEYRITARDGATHWLHDKGRFVMDEQGNRLGWQGVMVDITETKMLEEQLRQSQKLESVGRLAGGIAHDFNNMLTAINGYSELTLRRLEADNPLRRNLEEIKKAGERSALLTHQLLAFSRQQVLQPVVLDLNEVIGDTIEMLQRLIGEDVELVTALNPKTGRVNVDPGQLSQIIMNLAVNARDAMPQGGKLTIETANVFLKPGNVKQKIGILPGAYVMLVVCDTGYGIASDVQQHIFEPFFTTKEIGKGTGLGLATVYGIVKQSGGNIEVESRIGVGTTFRIYLPRVAEPSDAVETMETSAELPAGTETILLVEDEDLVRTLSRKMLEACGYTVVAARNGYEALEISENENYKFDLLMTDVVMPQMGGRELAEKLSKRLPNLRILFTSGYTDDAIVRSGVIETSTNFIQKPFTFDALNRKVRKLLDAEGKVKK